MTMLQSPKMDPQRFMPTDEPEEIAFPSETILGKYCKVQDIGRGSFATVFKAKDMVSGCTALAIMLCSRLYSGFADICLVWVTGMRVGLLTA